MEVRGWSDVATGQRLLTVLGRGEDGFSSGASRRNSPADSLILAL